MSNIAIKVENISKAYQLGEFSTGTLSNDIQRWWTMLRGKEDPYLKIGETNDRSVKGESDIVWSLKDINFEINQGDAVGIIGKNGAGKSTLLKLLSRVTSPTTGSIKVKGRIASLLEVGTGFHPELTGRENIYLNGAILGMRKKEITKKFDEIVAFSGVERYIDTPVKRYSSGMYVRLAFAVAAHLESEILIVDEVLAVGDAEFQKKCLGKMGDVSKGEGRTVLFVSHNMQAVSTLCSHGIVMTKGKASEKKSALAAIEHYFKENDNIELLNFPIVSDDVTIHNFKIIQEGIEPAEYKSNEPIEVFIDFEINEHLTHFRIGFFVKNSLGDLIHRSLLADWNTQYRHLDAGRYRLTGLIPAYYLVAGNYILQVHSSRFGIKDYQINEPSSKTITILPPFDYNQGYMGENIFGTIMIKQNWILENV